MEVSSSKFTIVLKLFGCDLIVIIALNNCWKLFLGKIITVYLEGTFASSKHVKILANNFIVVFSFLKKYVATVKKLFR